MDNEEKEVLIESIIQTDFDINRAESWLESERLLAEINDYLVEIGEELGDEDL